jgi:GNAT superfamily N-acetyltransferase
MVLDGMVNQERNLTIRDAGHDEEFAAWLSDLVELHPGALAESVHLTDHHLILADEIGDWIGGVRYTLRGGVAQMVEIGVAPHERHQGHGFRLLAAFEERARERHAHVAEFWADNLRSEGVLAAMGWHRVLQRDGYFGHRTWHLFEKRFPPSP